MIDHHLLQVGVPLRLGDVIRGGGRELRTGRCPHASLARRNSGLSYATVTPLACMKSAPISWHVENKAAHGSGTRLIGRGWPELVAA